MGKTDFDVIVIGAGVLGCFAARELRRYALRVCVLEKNADICAEITKANTAVIYAGYDMKPGTLKARLTVRGNREMETLCAELGVPYNKCGSLLVASGPVAERVLADKYKNGTENGVADLRLISGDEARVMEPGLSESVTKALCSQSTGTLDPWELGIAAAENAAANGAEFCTGVKVTGITYARGEKNYIVGYEDAGGGGEYRAAAVVNAAGLYGDDVLATYRTPDFRIVPTKAEFIVLDTYAAKSVKRIIFQQREEGKGVTIVPTVSGNVLVGPTGFPRDEQKDDVGTTADGQKLLADRARAVMPDLPLTQKIRSFAGERPNIFHTSGRGWPEPDKSRSISELTIREDDASPCLITFAGIKTPGLTCARQIGAYTAERVAKRLGGAARNEGFDARKRAPLSPESGTAAGRVAHELSAAPTGEERGAHTIICRCRGVTEADVRRAIRSLPETAGVNAVKRRTGAGQGRCQGGYCLQNIIEIIADERGKAAHEVVLEGKDSYLLLKPDEPMKKPPQSQTAAYAQSALMTAADLFAGDKKEARVNVAVIGGGPAGLAAAAEARRNGAEHVLIIERLPELGGLLGQCVHRGFGMRKYGGTLTGPNYAARLIDEAYRSGAEALTSATVTAVTETPGGITLDVRSASFGEKRVHADALVFAAGCRERPIGHLPVAGTRPAGIFTAGAAQRLMNVGGYSIGTKAVVLGSGDVGLIMSRQMKRAGMDVACVVEQSSSVGGMPRNVRECLTSPGIPLLLNRTVTRVYGASRVEGVRIAPTGDMAGRGTFVACDTLIVSVGLIPERDLLHGLPQGRRIFLCGNAHEILPLADDIATNGALAGRAAALFCR
ncbi:MAG: FAD-dependent oxidoreductase [Clostridiales Family XIII bacterium]|jgi:L-2-hydroxyglutarate oxidase LhgO|nr:FAD-dependent oxidoreductase [Clostridiales Family XIII bacterium]